VRNFAPRKPPFARQISALADEGPMIHSPVDYESEGCAIAHGNRL
jgi:hypothetical protein